MAILPIQNAISILICCTVILALLPTITSASMDINCDDDQYKHSLRCFLHSLELPIPDQEFKEWPVTLSIKGMSCSEVYIQDITVQTSSSGSDSQLFNITVGEVSATCHGKYHATGGIGGDLQATVAPQPAVPAVQVHHQVDSTSERSPIAPKFSRNSSTLSVLSPSKFTTQYCQTYVAATAIHFTGSISAKLIQAFERPIKHYLRETLQKTICPLLPQKLDPLMNEYLDKFNDWKDQYLPAAPSIARDSLILSTPTTTAQQRRLTRGGKSVQTVETGNSSAVSNPFHWNVPATVVGFLEDELTNHWQNGWLLFSSASQDYCDADCLPFTRGFSGIIPEHNQQIPLLIDKRVPVFDERLQLFIPKVQVWGIHSIDQVSTFGIMTNHSVVVLVPSMELTFVDSRNQLKLVFDVALNISSLSAKWDGLVQVKEWEQLKLLTIIQSLEDYINTGDISKLSCVLSTIDSVELSELITGISSESLLIKPVANSSNEDPLERDVDIALSTVTTQVLQEYAELWTLLSQGLVKGPVKELVNKVVKDWLASHSQVDSCNPLTMEDDPEDKPWWLDFTKWKMLYEFNDFLKGHTDGLNHYMDCIQRTIQHIVQSQLAHSSFFAKNWNTLTDVQLLQPLNSTVLGSKASIGSQLGLSEIPQMTLSLEVDNATIIGNATVNITIFASAHADTSASIKYDLNVLKNVTAEGFLQNGECGMVPAVQFHVLPETRLEFETVGVNVSIQVSEANQSILLSSMDYGDLVAQEAVDWGISLASAWINQAFDDWFAFQPGTCPGVNIDRSKPDDNGYPSWMRYPLVWVALAFVVLGQAGFSLVFRKDSQETETMTAQDVEYSLQEPLLRGTSDELMEPASMTLEEQSDAYDQNIFDNMRNLDESVLSDVREQLWDDEQGHGETDRGLPNKSKSLFQSSSIFEPVRFLFPIGAFGTMVILLASNLNVGASVNLSLNLGGTNTFEVPGVFEFSLVNTVTEFYQAGIYPLLFLVVGFSGIWPYLKLLLLLHAWVRPYPSRHEREARLLRLDALSKFSLVDTYVLVVMIVAFRMHMDLAQNYGLDVIITPEFGFYAFLLATCLSLLLGHGMLYYHRREARAPNRNYESIDEDSPESILDHAFEIQESGNRAPLSKFSQVLLFTGCLTAITSLMVGFFQPSFAFEVGGLAGMVLGNDSNRKVYSLFSMGTALSSSVPMNVGTVFLESAYFFFAMITPLVGLGCLVVLLLKPLPHAKQRSLLVAAEIANAWSAIEVFVLSIITALMQISTFASFMVGDKCDLVNQFLEDLAKRNDVIIPGLENMPVCFTVTASVDLHNGWFLIVGVLLNSLVMSTGLKLAHTAVEQRSIAMGEYNADHLQEDSDAPIRSRTWLEWFFAIPALRCIVFGAEPASGLDPPTDNGMEEEENSQAPGSDEEGSEHSETDRADWRHWF
ncbi:unnamed protein product [Cylindrotheca closterium]|uniref:Transmembrane protein n=1 Tax=Cylindrotheca closterium TaxID=2856 RepID=A0AAD2FTD1_9STRA|nr:unnamed protein product [Cylindrotheca closterium]